MKSNFWRKSKDVAGLLTPLSGGEQISLFVSNRSKEGGNQEDRSRTSKNGDLSENSREGI